MNLATLKLTLLALVFAWSQTCCCQVWAAIGSAQRAMVHEAPIAATSGCCASDPVPHTETEPRGIPCKKHSECGGCLPRLGYVPEGPSALHVDLVGAALPPALFPDPPSLTEAEPSGHGHARFSERSQRCLSPTLVRLRCALVI